MSDAATTEQHDEASGDEASGDEASGHRSCDAEAEPTTDGLTDVSPMPAPSGGGNRRIEAGGPGIMLLGYLLLGVQPIPVKALASYGWSPAAVVAGRFLFSLVCLMGLAVFRGYRPRTFNRRLLVLRGLFGGAAVLLYFTSIQLAGAGIGTVLNYTYPIWANLFAVLFLGARPRRSFWLLLGAAVTGVWLIVNPDWHASMSDPSLWGELAGVVSAALAGAAVLCIKELRRTDDSLTIITSFSLIGFLMALPLALVHDSTSAAETMTRSVVALWTVEAVGASLLVGLLSFFGHWLFTRGYADTSLELGTVLSLSVPVVATAAGALIFAEPVGSRFILGGLLILAAAVGIGMTTPRHPSQKFQ